MIGRTVGRYKIVSKIGEGGMGTVWKAEDPLLGRTIAIKFLPESLAASEEARKRFLREAQAASALDHPGIATVFDAGEADGKTFIAFRYVAGKTVADLISEGLLSLDEAVRITSDACTALQHAHSHGVLHRDVTSRNIMVNDEGQVVIVDFGLAVLEGASRITRLGTAMGTAAYLAPEVLQGQAADRRSDLYGLGVVLYEMLTGSVPFQSERPEALYYLAVHEAPAPVASKRNQIPERLDQAVQRALQKQPEARFQSAAEFRIALSEFGHRLDSSEAASPEASGPRAHELPPTERRVTDSRRLGESRSWTRHILRNIGNLHWMALILVIGTVGWLAWYKFGPRGGAQGFASVAVLPLRVASGTPAEGELLARGIGESLTAGLDLLEGIRVTPWFTSQRYAPDSGSLQQIATDLNVEALIVGSIRVVNNRIQGSVSLVDAASGSQQWAHEFEEEFSDIFAVQRGIALGAATSLKGRISGDERASLSKPPAGNYAAYQLYLQGSKAMQAEDRESKNLAFAYFEEAAKQDPDLDDAFTGMGAIQAHRFFMGWEGGAGMLTAARDNFRHALSIDPRSSEARRGVILVEYLEGNSEGCLRIGRQTHEAGWSSLGDVFVCAEAYLLGGQPDRAIPLLKEILVIDPPNRGALWFLLIAHSWAGQWNEALDVGQLYLDRFGEDAEVHTFMGGAYGKLDDLVAARLHCDRALELFGGNSNRYLDIGAADIYFELGDSTAARRILQTLATHLTSSLQAYPDNFRMRAVLAECFGKLGDKESMDREIGVFFSQRQTDGRIGDAVSTYVLLGDPNRAIQLLTQLADRGTDNFSPAWAYESWAALPGGADLLAKQKALNDRLRADY